MGNCTNCTEREAEYDITIYKPGSHRRVDTVISLCPQCKSAFQWGESVALDGSNTWVHGEGDDEDEDNE